MCDYLSEINEIRQSYSPPLIKTLKKPYWLKRTDRLNSLFNDSEVLFRHGHIRYAALVQANEILFHRTPFDDAPASFVFSTDPYFDEYPEELCLVASCLFDFKGMKSETVPPEYREIAEVIKDEYDRSRFDFDFFVGGKLRRLSFVTTIVFRKHLPSGMLTSSILPILADPDISENILILPKKYWSGTFKKHYKYQ